MNQFAIAPALLLLFAAAHAPAQDLVAHNGFEACWSHALTKPEFLGVLQSVLDGQTGCIPPNAGAGYTACNTVACAGNTLGCPVTAHAGAFTGDFGTGVFSAPGSVDDIAVPVDFGFAQCTIAISGVVLTYAPTFSIAPDGNDGAYMASLSPLSAVTIDSSTVSAPGACSFLAGSFTDAVKAQAQQLATAQMVAALNASAVGQSVCPLVP